MSRLFFAAPLVFAASLAAQVPAVPPVPPKPAPAPFPAVAPRAYTVDRAWADEIAAQAKSWSLNAFDNIDLKYNLELATEARFDAFNSLASLNSFNYSINDFGSTIFGGGPVAWAQGDPADSLYKQARDQFSRGDYRKAVDLFKSLPTKYPNSAYVADAQYWQAFSLYRIGTTPELQQALAVLEARKPDEGSRNGHAPVAKGVGGGVGGGIGSNSVTLYTTDKLNYSFGRGSSIDAAGLAARIANVLSQRGMSNDPAVKRALAAGGNNCDQEDQSVRAEALSALMQNDAETGRQMAIKILANKDTCSVPLRRNAVMLVGNKHDDAAVNTLIPVAKSDPSQSVRTAAVDYLIRAQTDAAITAVIDLARADADKQIQRAAVRSLAQSTNARARAEVRSIVESATADESLRISVIDGLDNNRITADDAAWLRGLYAKTTSTRIKDRIISAVGRVGGDVNNQWIQALLRNEDEPLESRTAALERAGRTMEVAALIKMYDASAQRPIRETVMQLLSERKEPEALDKILDIAKNGTDTRMRTQAINILSRSKDPRASKLLLQLVDH
ncbi:MAG: HEAT repeat domain-containing protein [Gemmatimonadota bacterium]